MGLIEKYLKYMYSKIADLYFTFSIDVTKWLISEVRTVEGLLLQATELVKLVTLVKEICFITNKLNSIITQSYREIVTARERVYEEGYEIRGVLVPSLSIQNYAVLRPPVQEVIIRTLMAPENLLVVWLTYDLSKEISALDKLMVKLSSNLESKDEAIMTSVILYYLRLLKDDINGAQNVLRKLSRSPIVLMLRNYAKSFREYEIRRMICEIKQSPMWKPKWVNEVVRLVEHYIEIKDDLNKLKVLIPKIKIDLELMRNFIKFIAYRLYELYTLYVLLKAISAMKHYVKVDFKKKRIELIDKSIIIFYTVSPQIDEHVSKLANVNIEIIDEANNIAVTECKYCGKPDFSLVKNAKVIILDCKFSGSVPYLSLSKYKIMAYMYEFNTDIGILVFPTVLRRYGLVDEREIEADKSLFVIARKYGAVKLNLKNSAKIYILSIIPLAQWEDRNIKLIHRIFKEIIGTT